MKKLTTYLFQLSIFYGLGLGLPITLIGQNFIIPLYPFNTRPNYLGSKCSDIDTSLVFGIRDNDSNGKFDDYGVDVLNITDQKTHQFAVKTLQKKSIFQYGESVYKIETGENKLIISPLDTNSVVPDLNIWKKFPENFKVFDLYYDTIVNPESFFIQNTDYVFLSFWAAYCEPCVKELPYIEQFLANKKTNVKVNFIHICIDNDLESCKSILNKISPPGDYIYCSRDQMEYLNAYYFPFGLLFDKNKNLVGGFNGLNALFNYLIKK